MKNEQLTSGVHTALITPFCEAAEGEVPKIDYASLESLIEWQISTGISGLVALGTTGESATLTTEERETLLRRVVEIVAGRVPLTFGCGTNDTAQTVKLVEQAAELGADAALIVVPYYNKPTQEGVCRHFEHIASATSLPLIAYNVPGRTVIGVDASSYSRIADLDKVIGCKHAVDSVSSLVALSAISSEKDFSVMAGDDPIFYGALCHGGTGVISASSNVIPTEMLEIYSSFCAGKHTDALAMQRSILESIALFFSETNPGPVKTALKALGHISSDAVRLPLVKTSESLTQKLYGVFAMSEERERKKANV